MYSRLKTHLLYSLSLFCLLVSTPVIAENLKMTVWKDPYCGCCVEWVEYLQANGFEIEVIESLRIGVREKLGIDMQYSSCHTAQIGDYVIEGHVPAEDIKRLLAEKPDAVGLAVPGMPIGSPGMDNPLYGGQKDRYHVLLLLKDGSSVIYNSY
ncbi:DUF411 domain-containing protein [Pasteurellaceae bacterium USgator11]|nr:DUF411 domain-containing protein [Pasteurellaceae bacterium USgator41]TNG96610.1 DUF411 domain-containing protein [Pasteurellaceae bacterium UScroc12]TNH00751.1 DUF411 domain-containing protein [Pasteurellaceae bacterium UScroc31]TNH02173.1 DUF411 domain-containing protein [Pasteurellaceae bacterium USgator11]